MLTTIDRTAGALKSVVPMLVSTAILGSFLFYGWAVDLPVAAYLRDRSLSDVPFAGFISDLGITFIALAGGFSGLAWRNSGEWALATLAIFAFVFALDDALMFHEDSGLLEFIIFGCFGLAFALVYVGMGRIVVWPLLLVGACFAFSVMIDVLPGGLPVIGQIIDPIKLPLEDVAKFAGICLLTVFAFSEYVRTRRQADPAL